MVTALIGGIYGGTKYVIYYYINLKQLYIDIIQFPPPRPNTSPRKFDEVLKVILINAISYILRALASGKSVWLSCNASQGQVELCDSSISTLFTSL